MFASAAVSCVVRPNEERTLRLLNDRTASLNNCLHRRGRPATGIPDEA
jgi:hypothetical protein